MLANGELNFNDDEQDQEPDDLPEGARKAPDGNYYVQTPEGGFARVEMNA